MHEKFKHLATSRRNERALFEWYEYLARLMECRRHYSFDRKNIARDNKSRAQDLAKTKETKHGNKIL